MPRSFDPDLSANLQAAHDPVTTRCWPAERLQVVCDAGLFRWGLPEDLGGICVTDAEMLDAYIELSRQCLTTAFILTQRNAACHRIAACDNASLRIRLLPDQCTGRAFSTVGISHLSTSRQHWARPSVVAEVHGSDFRISGEAPWVTGAIHADVLVTGATLPDGNQILAAIPTDREGITVGPPLRLLALNESHTGTVILSQVAVSRDEILIGPCPEVMKVGATGGTGSLTTSAVALGASLRTVDALRKESEKRTDLIPIVQTFSDQCLEIRRELLQPRDDEEIARLMAEQLRHRVNSLVSRTAQALMATAKGAGFVSGHPAERAIREAMFFSVWSCPPAVTTQTLSELCREPE